MGWRIGTVCDGNDTHVAWSDKQNWDTLCGQSIRPGNFGPSKGLGPAGDMVTCEGCCRALTEMNKIRQVLKTLLGERL